METAVKDKTLAFIILVLLNTLKMISTKRDIKTASNWILSLQL